MSIFKIRDRILEIQEQRTVLESEKEKLLADLRKQCQHETIIETPNEGSAFAPMRICAICGLEEEGWGCGYKELSKEPFMIVKDRNKFYEFRTLQPLEIKKLAIPTS